MTLSLPARTTQVSVTSGWLALVLFALITFLPALSALPVVDRDEARFVQASRQMVESGDYIDIRFQDEPRHKKPVGIYWPQSAAIFAWGDGPDAPMASEPTAAAFSFDGREASRARASSSRDAIQGNGRHVPAGRQS